METNSLHDVTTAVRRAYGVLERRPQAGLHDDAPALARWHGGTRVVASHGNGTRLETDLPVELGGTGDRVTPGWLFRAGLASCTAATIALVAAEQEITLVSLDVRASSRSDTRGLLGMADTDGTPVYGGPGDVQLQINLSAPGVAPERLHALVQTAMDRSPVPNATRQATQIAVHVAVGEA